MNKIEAYNMLVEVAKNHNTSVESVIERIEKSIQMGYISCIENKNEAGIKSWKEIPSEGELPNAVEIMIYLDEVMRDLPGEYNKPWNFFGF